jgi:hypothetical protein
MKPANPVYEMIGKLTNIFKSSGLLNYCHIIFLENESCQLKPWCSVEPQANWLSHLLFCLTLKDGLC